MKELSPDEWAQTVPDIELSEEEVVEGDYVACGNTEVGRAALLKLFHLGIATEGEDALLHVADVDKALAALEGVFVLVRRYQKLFYGPTSSV